MIWGMASALVLMACVRWLGWLGVLLWLAIVLGVWAVWRSLARATNDGIGPCA